MARRMYRKGKKTHTKDKSFTQDNAGKEKVSIEQ